MMAWGIILSLEGLQEQSIELVKISAAVRSA